MRRVQTGSSGTDLLSAQVAELEAQAAAEPDYVSEKECPSHSLEQLEALVETKDQVCERLCVPVCFLGPCLPSSPPGEPRTSEQILGTFPSGDPDAEEPD